MKMFLDSTFSKHEIMAYKHLRKARDKAKILLYDIFITVYESEVNRVCKTQNSGLRSKEEKPRDPINQPSRCNTQEGLLSVAQMGDSDLLGGRAPRTANWASFL